ncbi:MAG: AraC family ligand binding domain-containing protein, partial [[Mycobacterium] stephanolepidis]
MAEPTVATVPFREPEGTLPGVAVLTFAALLERARGHGVNPHAPLRADFHHLIEVNNGRLQAFVDFTEYQLAPKDWLWVRPHQVLEFGPSLETSAGFAVLFRPGFIDETTAAAVQLDKVANAGPLIQSVSATRAMKVLADEYSHRDDLPTDVHIDVVRRLLAVVLLCITHAGKTDSAAAGAAFMRFRDAVEHEFAHKHHVQDYARALGYSVRTVTRACREA